MICRFLICRRCLCEEYLKYVESNIPLKCLKIRYIIILSYDVTSFYREQIGMCDVIYQIGMCDVI